jgi:hypothetical protein
MPNNHQLVALVQATSDAIECTPRVDRELVECAPAAVATPLANSSSQPRAAATVEEQETRVEAVQAKLDTIEEMDENENAASQFIDSEA